MRAAASLKRACSRSTFGKWVSVRNVHDIENTVILTKSGTPLRVKDIAVVAQGPKIRLGQFGRAIHREDGKIIDNDDVVSAWVPMRKGAEAEAALEGLHEKVKELNDRILPLGRKDRSVHRSQRARPLHDPHRAAQPHRGLHSGDHYSVLVPGQCSGRPHRRHRPFRFRLLFASICLDLRHIPANLLSLGALDFGMVVDGAVVMVENIFATSATGKRCKSQSRIEFGRRRTKCKGPFSTPSSLSSPPICRSSRSSGWKGGYSGPWPGP